MKEDPVLLILEGTYPWYRGGVSEWVHQYLGHSFTQPFNILQVASGEYRHAPLSGALYAVPGHVQHFKRIPPPAFSGRWREDLCGWLDSVKEHVRLLVEGTRGIHIINTGFAGWLGKELAIRFNKKLLLTEHALYWKEIMMGASALECGYKIPEEPAEKKGFAKVFRSLAKEIYSAADIVVSVSKCNIREQRKMGAGRIHYIPNGIPEEWLRETAVAQTSILTVGWIGRCAEMKNPMKFFDVIDAFTRTADDKTRFLMLSCDAGEPGLARRVKAKSRTYAQLELIWDRSTRTYIDQMDLLCITSRNESQPLVLFEALGRKVLPAGWETGDATSEFGLFLEPKATAAELAAAVMRLRREPEDWERAVDRRFSRVKEHHTWGKIFSRYHALFSSLTGTVKI